jgi:hypothetical protein
MRGKWDRDFAQASSGTTLGAAMETRASMGGI